MGAIGLLVHRLNRAAGGEVVGRRVRAPFADVPFHPARAGLGFTGTMRYARGVATVLRALRPDLVEVHNRPEVALYLARRFRRVTLFLHNDPHGMRGAATVAERTVLLRRLARVVTVSEHLRTRFLEGMAGEMAVLPNCIDVPQRVRKVRERLILFVGRLVHDKGADVFVDACAAVLPHLPGWRAEMVGADRFSADSRPTSFTEMLHEHAAAAGVHLLGYRPHADTMDRMSRAAIAVVPSRWPEPFGLSALEAMAHGAALVCSCRGALPEVAGDAAVYANPEAPGATAAAILSLAQDADRRAALAAAGWGRAGGFDTAAAAEKLRALRVALVG